MTRTSLCILAAASLALAPLYAGAAAPVTPPAAQVASGEAVADADLEHRLGAELVIETTLNTVRRGVLVKYTNPALTLRLGPDHGSIQLSVPRETIRSVRVLDAAPQPAAQPEGK